MASLKRHAAVRIASHQGDPQKRSQGHLGQMVAASGKLRPREDRRRKRRVLRPKKEDAVILQTFATAAAVRPGDDGRCWPATGKD